MDLCVKWMWLITCLTDVALWDRDRMWRPDGSERHPMHCLHRRDYAQSVMRLRNLYHPQMNVRAHVQIVCVLHIDVHVSTLEEWNAVAGAYGSMVVAASCSTWEARSSNSELGEPLGICLKKEENRHRFSKLLLRAFHAVLTDSNSSKLSLIAVKATRTFFFANYGENINSEYSNPAAPASAHCF
jgi:hypothetical protein